MNHITPMRKLAIAFKAFIRHVAHLVKQPAPAPAHCGNINALLLHLCDFDYDLHDWVLRWIAYPLRNPGAKMSTALVVNGGHGTGLSLFFDKVVGQMHGDGARVIRGDLLDAAFNSWADNARYVLVEGHFNAKIASKVKHWVAGSHVTIKAKYERAQMQENQMNMVFLSSSDEFLPVSCGDRRFIVIEAPPAREHRFYQAVATEIQNGGVEVFQDYLMNRLDMKGFTPHTPPPTAHSGVQTLPSARLQEAA
jgi:hypothetical protein